MKNHRRGRHGGLHISAQAANGFLLAAVAIALITLSNAHAAEVCTPAVARVVSVQGNVELRRPQDADWQSAKLNATLCAGDIVRVHERSRAALLLSNETTLRLDQKTTLTLAGLDDQASLLDLLTGALHVITRTPKPFKVKTPFLNANVEGTEFFVGVTEESAKVAVYEGRVTAANDQGSVVLASGEFAVVPRNSGPRKEVMVRPRDAVQWALYYPTIFDYRLGVGISGTPGEAALRESIELYRRGNLTETLSRLENVPEGLANPRFLTYRAGLLLVVGRLDEAKPDIERALSLDPRSSDAYALQAVIALVEDDKDKALDLASKAVHFDPKSPTARLSLSYAHQAHFKIEDALTSVREAVNLDPQHALAWARVAELEMSTGRLDGALEAAQQAVTLNPSLAKTQSVLGFANLVRFDTTAALTAFEKAIELDQADPLPRMGLGLAKIREGDLRGGREEIEIAASLDPGDSLVRSYLGKAYYEEKRDRLAATQFDLAKKRDPKDPTPWFYDAIRKQTENRPVEGLEDLQKSIELNDNRAVYRSRLLLDQDQAARSASQARIYTDLGFEQLALVEGYKSVNTDPGDYSAHRFLADSYLSLPRHEIARVSELLQSQLRQPLNLTPLQPQLGDSRSFILSGAGPARPGFDEFNALFNRNQSHLQLSGVSGGDNTLGDQVVVSGIQDRLAFSAGQFHFETDGFRENNDLKKDIYNIFLQSDITSHASLQAEFRQSEVTNGDLALRFDPENFSASSRLRERNSSVRLGARYTFSPTSDIIASPIFQESHTSLDVPDLFSPFLLQQKERSTSLEIQHLYRGKAFNLTTGAGHYQITRQLQINGSEVPGSDGSDTNLYSYAQFNWRPHDVTINLGLSYDLLRDLEVRRNQVNPKFGIVWNPQTTTTVRVAVFRMVKRAFIADQSIEPTQVAGFNQFFDDLNGTVSRRVGIAVDQKISKHWYAGLEASARSLTKVPFITVGEFEWKEQAGRSYVYWTPSPWLALSAEYHYERFQRPPEFTGAENMIDVKTHRFPLGLNVFSPFGLSVRLVMTYTDQEGQFLDSVGNPFAGNDRFWLLDATLTYRLPGRLGQLAIEGRNLFDKAFRFQETDAATPRIAPRRLIFARWTLTL
jgi:tetratricopeptide (TPR) repeat protein